MEPRMKSATPEWMRIKKGKIMKRMGNKKKARERKNKKEEKEKGKEGEIKKIPLGVVAQMLKLVLEAVKGKEREDLL